jgi:hypothetical protein
VIMSGAVWFASDTTRDLPLESGKGKPPDMPHAPWKSVGSLWFGATDRDRWYWRHSRRDCRHWCGPYLYPGDATEAARLHRSHCPAEKRKP